jgi:tRNA threonylcarbamoyl adenosine modification protein YeaZ
MKILAIETATPASSVALGEDEALVAMSVHVDRRGHVGFLVPALDFCFAQAGWKPGDVELVAVDVGPGPYTGIRAGIATAQAIAAAVGAPIVTVSSLTVLAMRAATGRRRIWPIVDARRGQIATCPYRPVPGGVVRDGVAEIATPDEFKAMIESDPTDTLIVGDWPALGDSFFRGLHRVRKGRPRYPSADVVLEYAMLRAGHGDYAGPEEVRPLYMREPDAAINWSAFREEEGMWPGAAS